ncbi:hydrogenase expression protein HupH [Biomaibacter acetigenes]|uniref:Hydrogenase expression protein HupH n=2 Tax=Biomaibacter acetigenes TaxID=2316383 RepID=A0A3G2R8Q9_9FIRM|nr:hydrogenase expression protein HupH [Biomaibacter acetigenes]
MKGGSWMRILFIRPIITERPDFLEEEILKQFAAPDTIIKAKHLEWGVDSIESEYDLVFSAPFVVKLAEEAEKEGYDGIVSYCFVNPGVDAAREAVSIPILGSGEAAVNLALNLGRRIGIITILPNLLPLIRKQNQTYINMGRIMAIDSVNIPVLGLTDNDRLIDILFEKASQMIYKDEVDVIVLGCTGFGGIAKGLSQKLIMNNLNVPVIDPAGASVKVMEAIIGCNVRHSKKTFMPPIDKIRKLPI